MISLHADSPWQPSTFPASLLRAALDGRAWRIRLRREGYTDEEVAELVEGVAGDSRHPGLVAAVAAGLEDRAPEDRGPEALAGLVAAYLEHRPPLAVLNLNPAPPPYLSPEDLGRRLVFEAEGHDLGELARDRLTGLLWVVAFPSARVRPRMIAASALYDLVGLAAIRWRLVEVDGRLGVCAREPLHWHALKRGELAQELERQAPADVWLGNERGTAGVRKRLNPIPGLPAVVRWDLGQAFAGDPKLRATSTHAPMIRAIVRVSDARIRRSVQIAGLAGEAAAELYGTILTRREALRAQLDTLTGRSGGR